jgi:hypothetical protein
VAVSRIVDVMLAGSDDDTEAGAVVAFGATDNEDEAFVPLDLSGRVDEADTELEDVKELGAPSRPIADGDAEPEETAGGTELKDVKVFKELGAASGPIADAKEDEGREARAEGIAGPMESVMDAAGETDEEASAEVKADGRADWRADGKADRKASGPLEADAMELLETAEEDDGPTSAASS